MNLKSMLPRQAAFAAAAIAGTRAFGPGAVRNPKQPGQAQTAAGVGRERGERQLQPR